MLEPKLANTRAAVVVHHRSTGMATRTTPTSSFLQPTLTTLEAIGSTLRWHPSLGLLVPTPTTSDVEQAEPDGWVGELLRSLARRAQALAEQHSLGSLLAGADNESDEPADLPVYLGRLALTNPSASEHDPATIVDRLLPLILPTWAREATSDALVVRKFHRPPASSTSAASRPADRRSVWMLDRLLASGLPATTSSAAADATPADLAALERLIRDHLDPRLELELRLPSHPNITLCCLLAQVRRQGSESSGPPPHPWGGLISYRIST